MAYRRYGSNGDWYIYWEASSVEAKENERLAVWHVDHRASKPEFSYREVLAMLGANNFEQVPGYSARETDILRQAFEAFVEDVDAEYGQRAS
jgi:hypothetical protein